MAEPMVESVFISILAVNTRSYGQGYRPAMRIWSQESLLGCLLSCRDGYCTIWFVHLLFYAKTGIPETEWYSGPRSGNRRSRFWRSSGSFDRPASRCSRILCVATGR